MVNLHGIKIGIEVSIPKCSIIWKISTWDLNFYMGPKFLSHVKLHKFGPNFNPMYMFGPM